VRGVIERRELLRPHAALSPGYSHTRGSWGGGSRVRGGVERKGLVRKEEEDRVDGG
jgi:hypothetical protein